MPRQVLGCGTEGNRAFENLQADFAPLADGFEDDAARDERLCQVAPVCPECICPDDDGSWEKLAPLPIRDGIKDGQSTKETEWHTVPTRWPRKRRTPHEGETS